MCGRYFFDLDSEELSALYKKIQEQARQEEKLAEEIASGEVYPTNHVITIGGNKDNKPVAGVTRWGFTGFKKGQLMINARSESVEEKKTFAKSFQENRCVFPMSGFYEWDHDKKKYLFTEGKIMYVAGFYRIHHSSEGAETESIIMTTKPNESVAKIHDRMPLIIEKKSIGSWIADIDFAREYINAAEMPALERTLVS